MDALANYCEIKGLLKERVKMEGGKEKCHNAFLEG